MNEKEIAVAKKKDWDAAAERVLFAGGIASIAFMLLVFFQIATGRL